MTLTIAEDELTDHIEESNGICISCGEWTCGGVEPDAERYTCECCDKPAVYGAEQALVCGFLAIE
jgi:hypothetical protein